MRRSLCTNVVHNGIMSVMSASKKKQRRCSVCREFGHTKQACTQREAEKKSPYVFVRVLNDAPSSPHILSLSDGKDILAQVPVYSAAARRVLQRHILNPADMVRAAKRTAEATSDQPKVRNTRKTFAFSRLRSFFSETLFVWSSGMSGAYHRADSAATGALHDAGKTMRRLSAQLVRPARFLPGFFLTLLFVAAAVALPIRAAAYYQTLKNDTEAVIAKSADAFLSLQSSTVAALSSNIEQAQYDLNSALASFGAAENLLKKEHRALLYVARLLPVIGPKVQSRQHVLTAGHHLALGNTYLVKGVSAATADEEQPTADRLAVLRSHIRSAIPQYEAALDSISRVDADVVPSEYAGNFADFKILFSTFVDDLKDTRDVLELLGSFLGEDSFRRYLLVFQNNHEIRPAGGFIGSMAVLDMQKGRVLNMEVPGGGSYDLQGQLDVYLRPPLPLQLVNYRWHFHDGNWFPNFPDSAEKLMYFFQHSRNTTADGVVAINASVLPRVLRVLGPVASQEYDFLADADTILNELQYKVEVDYDREENTPKAVIAGLLEELIAGVREVEPERLLALLTELSQALEQKEIQTYLADERAQARVREFGFGGVMADVEQGTDYLMVVNTNVGGGKSDARIKEQIAHQAVVEGDGSVVDTVIIRRTHGASGGEQFYGVPNIDYIRVFVPEGSELINSGGFSFPPEESFLVPPDWYEDDADILAAEKTLDIDAAAGTRITREHGKTVFGNWVYTEPGAVSEVFFTYRLPFGVFSPTDTDDTSSYSIIAQKQSGMESELVHAVIYPDAWSPAWRADDETQLVANGAVSRTEFLRDRAFGVVMRRDK